MSHEMVRAVLESRMRPTQKLVALALAEHAHKDGTEARPGMALLVRETSLSERAIQSTLRSLVDEGWIVIQRKATATKPQVYQFRYSRGCTLCGGASGALGGCTTGATPPQEMHPNLKEPLLNQRPSSTSSAQPVDITEERRNRATRKKVLDEVRAAYRPGPDGVTMKAPKK